MSSELIEEYSTDEWWVEEGYATPEDVPIPDWHVAILQERIARYGVHFPEGKPWEELEKQLRREILEAIEKRKK